MDQGPRGIRSLLWVIPDSDAVSRGPEVTPDRDFVSRPPEVTPDRDFVSRESDAPARSRKTTVRHVASPAAQARLMTTGLERNHPRFGGGGRGGGSEGG